MRVVLITTPTRLEVPNQVAPVGILSLAAYLESIGHAVKVIDAAHRRPTHHEIAREAAEFSPDLVGIGGIITSYAYIIGLAQVLKQVLPRTPIVIGGQVVINNTRQCFEYMPIEYVIHGYGEIPLAKLLEHLDGRRDIKDIPGLSYLDGGRIATNPGREFFKSADELPFPAYHQIDMEHYCNAIGKDNSLLTYLKRTGKKCDNFRYFGIMGALGCIAKCTFCIHEQEYVGVRFFSPEYIVRHMQFLKDNYNVNVFSVGEEMYIASLSNFKKLNQLIIEKLPDVFWRTHGRAECFTDEIVEELSKGNIYSTAFGAESLCTRILEIMNKRSTRERNIASIQKIFKTKIVGTFTFIVGNVGENQESINETLDGISQLNGPQNGGAFFATPYPGGRIWDWAVERGIITDVHNFLLRLFNQNALNFSVNLTPYPDWVVRYWWLRVNVALRLVSQKRKFWSSKRLKPSLLAHGAAVWAYFAWLRIARLLGGGKLDSKFDFAVDANGALLPDSLRKGTTHLPPSSGLLAEMLKTGPSYEPFTDRRSQHVPPAWWKGSFVPLRS